MARSLGGETASSLEAWRDPEHEARIAVEHWCAWEPVTDQYIERPRRLRMVWNYVRHIGPVAVWRKIRSRLAEQRRNRKVAAIGVGIVVEAPPESGFGSGQRVMFYAPNHSLYWPSVCLDLRLISPANDAVDSGESGPMSSALPEPLRQYAGWSPMSGMPLDSAVTQRELRRLAASCRSSAPASTSLATAGRERLVAEVAPANQLSAAIFGLGNYAKTQIVPPVRRHLRLCAIHEIDPDQISSAADLGVTLDTDPWPRDAERYDAWFIAGFHHTHARIALRALQDGAYAIVEKPLVTTRPQLELLETALKSARKQRLFTCFQRRYWRINAWARSDLGIAAGDAVDMHCIVYEIPLPTMHWYNWPNSGSRLVSNGCHWLDYFLFMNDWSPVTSHNVHPLRGSDLAASVRLENGAQLVMSLTDTGSERLGVRDVIELRASDATVRIVDATYYSAENTSRVLRKRRVNPMRAFGTMYDTICRRITRGEEGDSPESLRSSALMLDLEDALQAERSA